MGKEKSMVSGSLVVKAAKFLEKLRVNTDFMTVEFDCDEEKIYVIDHDGNVISSCDW